MIKTLGAYVKEFKRASIATPCYMILEVLMEMMIPYLMASIIDDGVNKGAVKHIWAVCMVQRHQQDLPVILEKECMIIFRPFHFPTLINFQLPVS